MSSETERQVPRAGIRLRSVERRELSRRVMGNPGEFRSVKGGGTIFPRSEKERALVIQLEADPKIASWRRFD